MTDQSLKDKLIEIIQSERQIERDMVASLSEEARNAEKFIDRWGVKNVITHISSAKFGFAGDLTAGREGKEVTPFNAEYQAFNDRTYAQYQHASWDEVNAYADASVETLIAEVAQYDDAQLQQPNLQTWMDDGGTVSGYVFGFCVGHAYQHIAQLYAESGQPDTAYALLESAVTLHQSLNASPRDVAVTRYDIAAGFATMGRGDLAIPQLQMAVRDDPGFRAWLKKDRSFNTLHGNAEFEALCA